MAPPAGLTRQSSAPAKRGVRGGTQKNVCRLAGVACFGRKPKWCKIWMVAIGGSSGTEGKKFQKGIKKKNVHKYMLCIYLYIYRCDHGGVGANRASFCAFVAGGKGAAREENKEERKKEKQKQCIFFGLVMSMETVQAQQMRSVPTEVVCV